MTEYTVLHHIAKMETKLSGSQIPEFPSQKYFHGLIETVSFPIPELKELGFEKSEIRVPEFDISEHLIRNYADKRDLPTLDATGNLEFICVWNNKYQGEVTRKALEFSEVFLNELI